MENETTQIELRLNGLNELTRIGQRLVGLREAVGLSIEEFAQSCDLSAEELKEYEAGAKELSVSVLKRIAQKYNIDVTTLMFGDEPRMNSYFITRKDKGATIKRVEHYKYEALAAGFNGRKADVFVVTVEPCPDDAPIHLSIHSGQEFNLILEGKMLIRLHEKDIVLDEGDSIYFDASQPHGMKALNGKRVKFLAVVL
ncbi:MAG: XRE family transcriptional regulator [Prevotella sp.]|nr:XRE family transcriptional regulator [Prevotella sp.]